MGAVNSDTFFFPKLVDTLGGLYGVDDLPQFASGLETDERRVAGMCLAYFVKKDIVLLERQDKRARNGKNYYRRPKASALMSGA